MQQGLLHLHNILRWFVLIFALWTIFKSLADMNSGKAFTGANKRPALFLMISCDIQLLLGLILYFTGAWGIKNIQNQGMAAVMKDHASRFWAVEHITGMIIAIVLVHIGYSSTKKNIEDKAKFRKLFWFTVIALLIILFTIPWPFRQDIGRAMFPGM
ncbi:MAG: hypothetical protein BGO70_12680 [Bacteroidetes bacterium 43-93]|jgi:hypothetical protein|nr:hypothetical protein [Bacteroidota bacterium]OJW99300.1 MAG: hypothetical protein BGO70_12680 [Bacteroidetes bacterium 43-93]